MPPGARAGTFYLTTSGQILKGEYGEPNLFNWEEMTEEIDWEKKYKDLLERHENLIDKVFFEIVELKKRLKN